ncbi:MAG: DNA adenine methylase [Thermoplasmata archaeon]
MCPNALHSFYSLYSPEKVLISYPDNLRTSENLKRRARQSRLDVGNQRESAQRLTFRKLKSVNNPNSIHGIYPYRGKISAIDAQQIIRQLPQEGTLLDPFCGSGTIVYEAQSWGLSAIGIDNNPLAIALTLAKTQENDLKRTYGNSRRLLKKAKGNRNAESMPEWSARFFHPRTAKEVMSMYALEDEMSAYERAVLYGATCLTARACNHYVWSSNAVGKIMEPLSYVSFYDKYTLKLKKHSRYLNEGTPATVIDGDSRRLSEILDPESVDFVYTSPPYFDALDYTSYYARIIYNIKGTDTEAIRKRLIQNVKNYASDMGCGTKIATTHP